MEKDYMFQYYNGHKMIEDTELITKDKAYELWDHYYPDAKNLLRQGAEVQICLWMDCTSNTDYGKVDKEIDYRDCEYDNGSIYKITKTLISK